VEVPRGWSQIATDILAQKYFRKAGVPQPDGSLGRETSVKQVAHRMANCWKVWGVRYGYFATEKDATVFYEELVYSILNQACVPNSPQWFNTGLYESYGITGKPQGHYFVDQVDGILKKGQATKTAPKVMHTQSSSEYWHRSGSLVHTDPLGERDADIPGNERADAIAKLGRTFEVERRRAVDDPRIGEPKVASRGPPGAIQRLVRSQRI
jgi:hypothetical protein